MVTGASAECPPTRYEQGDNNEGSGAKTRNPSRRIDQRQSDKGRHEDDGAADAIDTCDTGHLNQWCDTGLAMS